MHNVITNSNRIRTSLLLIFLFSFTVFSFGIEVGEEQPVHTAGKRLVKGTWSAGGTFSGKSKDFSHIDLLFADVDKYYQKAYTLRLEGAYFFKENLSSGLGLYYGTEDNLLSINVLDNLMSRELQSNGQKYGALGFIKNHIPASNNYLFL